MSTIQDMCQNIVVGCCYATLFLLASTNDAASVSAFQPQLTPLVTQQKKTTIPPRRRPLVPPDCLRFPVAVCLSSSSASSSCLPCAANNDAASIDENTSPNEANSGMCLRAMTFENLEKATEPQLLSDFLMELGACSVAITDHDRDTDAEWPIFREPSSYLDKEEEGAAVIWRDDAVGKNVWMHCDLTAHFPSSVDLVHVADQVRLTLEMPTMPRYRVDDVPDRDWVVHVQSSWKPAVVDGFVLRFPWHDDDDVVDAVAAASDDGAPSHDVADYTQLQLQGGIAFGTGEHPTTQLCLSWIRDALLHLHDGGGNGDDDDDDDNDTSPLFLDYGSGSGVLGMAACAISKSDRFRSVGVDIDPDAVRIADYNAQVNGLEMTSYLPPSLGNDHESDSLIMKALHRTETEVLPEELDGPFYDACAANILAGSLRSLVGTIAGMVKGGGKIGLSGILSYQAGDVVETYSEFFDDVKVEREQSGWVLISGTRKLDYD